MFGNSNPSDYPMRDEPESSCADAERTSEMEEVSEGETEKDEQGERERDVERVRERNRRMERPPVDDFCPICFGSFTVPCRAPCGHWFCGDCILEYWNHGKALQPCKCPMCSQLITGLTPEASFDHCEDVEILKHVQKYNRVFVGGKFGLILKMFEFPLLMRRIFREMMDPDAACRNLFKVRVIAIFLGALYTASPLDFLPTGRLDAVDLFDYLAIALVLILYEVGLYRRRRQRQLVRQLAAVQP